MYYKAVFKMKHAQDNCIDKETAIGEVYSHVYKRLEAIDMFVFHLSYRYSQVGHNTSL